MANEEQLSILRQGVEVWNKWRDENRRQRIDFHVANLSGAFLGEADLSDVDLRGANLSGAFLAGTDLKRAILVEANLSEAFLTGCDLRNAHLNRTNFWRARIGYAILGNLDLSEAIGLEDVYHTGPSNVSTDTFVASKGRIHRSFLEGCGLSDWEIELVKLYNPDLTGNEFIKIQNRIFDLRNQHAIQTSPLFISYSHADVSFVDKLEVHLNQKGIRFWRDVHDMKAGRMETQIDRAIRQNPTLLLILSQHSLISDWVEHEVRMARGLEKELGRDVLCPVALDSSWKSSPWPKRLMEQIMEYNILDFSAWEDDSKFDAMFRKLIDGLELFYKG